jgi:hypothetical protein
VLPEVTQRMPGFYISALREFVGNGGTRVRAEDAVSNCGEWCRRYTRQAARKFLDLP